MVPVIAVTGAGGRLGGRVARRLAEREVATRLLGRDPSRLAVLPGAVIAPAASYGDGEAMRQALDGADTLFLVSAHESPDRVREHITAVDAAVAAGVGRIVYVSFLGAAPDATFTYASDHWHTEEYIRSTGLRYTFLRDSFYLAEFPAMAGADGVIRGPAGDGRVAGVAHEDVADVAETRAEAYASRAEYGAEEWEVTGWVSSYQAMATGEMATVSAVVPRLTGHHAKTFGEFLREHPDIYRHLVR